MGERNIVKNDFAFLHKKSKIVEDFNENLNVLLDDMAETLHSKKGAVGLAAVQVGILKRVVVIDVGEGLIELVNPEIIEEKDGKWHRGTGVKYAYRYATFDKTIDITDAIGFMTDIKKYVQSELNK